MTDQPVPELDDRFSEEGAAAVPWETARAVLESAQISWISTVRADGRPHVSPLVAVWQDGALYFSTGAEEQKGRNLAGRSDVVVTTGCNDWEHGIDVVVEGTAERVVERDRLERLAAAWATKWDGSWRFDVDDDGFVHAGKGRPDDGTVTAWVFEVRPTKVLAFGRKPFSHTRYRPTSGTPMSSAGS